MVAEGASCSQYISDSVTPGLTAVLCGTGSVCLGKLMDTAGPELNDAQTVCSLLSLRSHCCVKRMLDLWRQILTVKKLKKLRDYSRQATTPNQQDAFQDIKLSLVLGEMCGPLLTIKDSESLTLYRVNRKLWQRNCIGRYI